MTRSSPYRVLTVPQLIFAFALAISHGVNAAEPQATGAQVYSKYCALCHGAQGKGDGRAAVLQQRPPANLTQSRRTYEYKLDIVRRGGAALNRSSGMPAWSEALTDREITDVVAYLQTLVQQDPAPSAEQSTAATATASAKAP